MVENKEEIASLECSYCDKLTAPHSANKDGSVTYLCRNSAKHPASEYYCWRIGKDGDYLEKTSSGRWSNC